MEFGVILNLFKVNIISLSDNYVTLLWAGFSPATRKSYEPAIRSFEYFYRFRNQKFWPASELMLG